jgi:hypothetical protein
VKETWPEEEGDGPVDVLGMVAAGGDLVAAGAMHQTDGGVARQPHHGRSLTDVDQSGVLAAGDSLIGAQRVVDRPMATPRRQRLNRVGPVRRQAGDAGAPRPVCHAAGAMPAWQRVASRSRAAGNKSQSSDVFSHAE